MKVAIVVLNWNNAPDTIECLASLEKLHYPHTEVLVVDNGSTDGSLGKIRIRFPDAVYVENGENLGFAEGNNRGLKEALERKADLIILLNNDTIVDPHFVDAVVASSKKHEDVGVFGPKIFFRDQPEVVWYAGGGVDPKTGRCYHIGAGATEGHDEEMLTDYVCGCALAIRREVIEKVGLLSADYFLLWEEIDWCWRIRKAGYFCHFVPEAKVWHKVSHSFVEGNRGPMWHYFYHRNRLLFHKQHSKWSLPKSEALDLLKKGFSSKTSKGEKKRARAALFGILDYHLGRFGKGRLAKFIQNR